MQGNYWPRQWLLILVESWLACGEVVIEEQCQNGLEAFPIDVYSTSMLQLDVNISDMLARSHAAAAQVGKTTATRALNAPQANHSQLSSDTTLNAVDAPTGNEKLHAAAAKLAAVTSTQPSTAQQIGHPPQSSKVQLSAIDASARQKQKVKSGSGTVSFLINIIVLFLIGAFGLLLWHNGSFTETVQEVRNNPKDLIKQFEDGQAQDSLRQIGRDTGVVDRRAALPCC